LNKINSLSSSELKSKRLKNKMFHISFVEAMLLVP